MAGFGGGGLMSMFQQLLGGMGGGGKGGGGGMMGGMMGGGGGGGGGATTPSNRQDPTNPAGVSGRPAGQGPSPAEMIPNTGFGIGGGHFTNSEPPKPRTEDKLKGLAAKKKGDVALNDTQSFDPNMFMQFLQQLLSQSGGGQEAGGFEQNFGRKGSFSSGYGGGQ